MRTIRIIPVLIATLGAMGCASGIARKCTEQKTVNHVVVVWLNDEFRNDAGVARLVAAHEVLREIPGLVSLSVGRVLPSDRAIVDSSFDVASHFTFCSTAAMNAYLQHPVHQQFLREQTVGRVKKVVVYDFVE
ncbi:MAG: Dabb family protein [Steroidobacteraceae bacterium]